MAKIRNIHRFGTAPNTLLNDVEISLKAKGLYTYMDSKPETWDFTIKGIVSQLKESFDAVRGAINELETAGYLSRQQFKDEKGQWDCDYELYPDPTLNPNMGKPYRENPHTVNSVSGKPLHISNKEMSKKEKENKFEEFWGLYPRKTGKGKAKQSYQKAIAKIPEQNLIQALKDRLEDLGKLESQFIPHPSTWLNQERWEDEITNKPVTPATPEEVEQRRQEWQESLARTQTSKPIQNIQTSYFKPLNLF